MKRSPKPDRSVPAGTATAAPGTDGHRSGADAERGAVEVDDTALETVRIDKWLWAARFFRTRSLAARAVAGGLVQVGDQRVKASRRLRRGETVHIRRGVQAWDVVVRGLRDRRRPAPEAQSLYEETPGSVERRTGEEARREQARLRRDRTRGRPTKRERRELDRWRERRSGVLDGLPETGDGLSGIGDGPPGSENGLPGTGDGPPGSIDGPTRR